MASTRVQVESPVLRTISDFKAKMTGGGARPNLFEVVLQFPLSAPTDTDTLQKSRFLVKAAALPASNITPYRSSLPWSYIEDCRRQNLRHLDNHRPKRHRLRNPLRNGELDEYDESYGRRYRHPGSRRLSV